MTYKDILGTMGLQRSGLVLFFLFVFEKLAFGQMGQLEYCVF